MPKAIAAVAQWLAAGNNFDQLSRDQQRAAWLFALFTHVFLVPVTYVVVHVSPALRPAFGNYLVMHFLIALLFAKGAEGASVIWKLVFRDKPRFERNGWLFTFGVTLLPLLVTAFLLWLCL